MAVAVRARKGQFATTDTAYQQTPLRAADEGHDRNHAYLAIWQSPVTNYAVCNPLDYREPPVAIASARLTYARTELVVILDQDSDRGRAFGLPLARWFDCGEVFDARTEVLLNGPGQGTRASCRFSTDRELRVRLGSASGIDAGDYVQFQGGRVFSARGRSMSSVSAAEV